MVILENVQSGKPPVYLALQNHLQRLLRPFAFVSPFVLDNESAFSDSVNIPSDDHIEISLSNKQLKELILRYTNELPPQQKLVFMLRDVEELEVIRSTDYHRIITREDKKYSSTLPERIYVIK